MNYGFIKVGASVPEIKIADPSFNLKKIKEQIDLAIQKNIQILLFPELSMTGYTCADLFFQDLLIQECYQKIGELLDFSKNKKITFMIGAPIQCDHKLYNCAIVIQKGKILGIVPKTYLANYGEFYEKRWFQSSKELRKKEIILFGQKIPIGTDLLFCSQNDSNLKFGIELCEDVWSVSPKSNDDSVNGATLIFNLSASNETVGKYEYRKDLIKIQSSKTISGYIYASSGVNESSTDILFSGSSLIYENGILLKENQRFDFESNLIEADIDIQKIVNDRLRNTSFKPNSFIEYREIPFMIEKIFTITRKYSKMPFVPSDEHKRKERCQEILNIQSSALAKRLKHIGIQKCILGISGGLDSTLAFLVILKAYEKLKIDPSNLIAVTMPGFGTTGRTYHNAVRLVEQNHATLLTIDIKQACEIHFRDIGQNSNHQDVTYENSQARERTQILMDIANKENGIVIGTGDLSELALGWCTYNGDHMSMYAVNSGIPKTLVKYLVKFVADTSPSKEPLYDILDTPISPELLPPTKKGEIKQITEDKIGPYILHDFYLYHFLRYGASPRKIYELAKYTFQGEYSDSEILKWLKVFMKRFFTQQFKRNCMPDGVKVGSITLSPRGDLRMPSDACYQIWLDELEN